MQVINIVEVKRGIVENINSFVKMYDTNASMMPKAEALFTQKVKEINPNISDDDIADSLDTGRYFEDVEPYREVCLVWSDTAVQG